VNIVNTLTSRHMKLNKKRTIVTIIGIILSVSMLTAVPTFVASLMNMIQKVIIADTGNWHVLYADVEKKDIDKIVEDKNTASAVLSRDVGYAILDGSKNENKPYLFIKSYDKRGFENFNVKLIEGRFPQNSGEIVISSHIEENGGVVYKVGDVLKLDIGQRYLEEDGNKFSLGQDSGFKKKREEDNESGEKFVGDFAREYTVTGIIKRPGFEPYWAPGYTAITYLDIKDFESTDVVNVSVAWEKISKKANEAANELGASLGIPDNNIIYNRELLRYYGILGDDLLRTLYSLAAIVITLIIVGSVALIYNSFAISISERSRHLGMLASVGATKKQKRNSVFYESFIVGIIGVPLGIFFGTLGMGITFALVEPLIEDLMIDTGVRLTLKVSPTAILVALVLSVITIFVSAYIPARRASKISPIDAIRQSRDIKLTGRSVKTSKLTRAIFGFEAELGLKNLKRNSRRYKTTIFSLIISIVLFLSVSSLSLLSQRSVDIISDTEPYDVMVGVTSSATVQEKKDFYKGIAAMEHAEESVIEKTMFAQLNIDDKLIPDEIKEIIKPYYHGEENRGKQDNRYEMDFDIKSVDEVTLNRYAKEVGVDVNTLKDKENPKGILVNTVTIQEKEKNKYTRMNHFNIKAGEKLEFIYSDNDSKDNLGDGSDNSHGYSKMLEVAALADKTPIGRTTLTSPYQGMFIISEEIYNYIEEGLPEKYHSTRVEMFIKSSDPVKLIDDIEEYQKRTSIADLYVYSPVVVEKANKQFQTFVFVFFYGFVALITAICVTNILNTISTSISLRKREFAMLKSVGMTPKGFNKMINYESLFYGIKALLYGLPISFGMMYLIYKVLSNSFGFAFAIPWGSVLATIIVVFAIVGSTMLYASSKIKKENIIDALKNENV
jgi:putative ABC transport system permease protein